MGSKYRLSDKRCVKDDSGEFNTLSACARAAVGPADPSSLSMLIGNAQFAAVSQFFTAGVTPNAAYGIPMRTRIGSDGVSVATYNQPSAAAANHKSPEAAGAAALPFDVQPYYKSSRGCTQTTGACTSTALGSPTAFNSMYAPCNADPQSDDGVMVNPVETPALSAALGCTATADQSDFPACPSAGGDFDEYKEFVLKNPSTPCCVSNACRDICATYPNEAACSKGSGGLCAWNGAACALKNSGTCAATTKSGCVGGTEKFDQPWCPFASSADGDTACSNLHAMACKSTAGCTYDAATQTCVGTETQCCPDGFEVSGVASCSATMSAAECSQHSGAVYENGQCIKTNDAWRPSMTAPTRSVPVQMGACSWSDHVVGSVMVNQGVTSSGDGSGAGRWGSIADPLAYMVTHKYDTLRDGCPWYSVVGGAPPTVIPYTCADLSAVTALRAACDEVHGTFSVNGNTATCEKASVRGCGELNRDACDMVAQRMGAACIFDDGACVGSATADEMTHGAVTDCGVFNGNKQRCNAAAQCSYETENDGVCSAASAPLSLGSAAMAAVCDAVSTCSMNTDGSATLTPVCGDTPLCRFDASTSTCVGADHGNGITSEVGWVVSSAGATVPDNLIDAVVTSLKDVKKEGLCGALEGQWDGATCRGQMALSMLQLTPTDVPTEVAPHDFVSSVATGCTLIDTPISGATPTHLLCAVPDTVLTSMSEEYEYPLVRYAWVSSDASGAASEAECLYKGLSLNTYDTQLDALWAGGTGATWDAATSTCSGTTRSMQPRVTFQSCAVPPSALQPCVGSSCNGSSYAYNASAPYARADMESYYRNCNPTMMAVRSAGAAAAGTELPPFETAYWDVVRGALEAEGKLDFSMDDPILGLVTMNGLPTKTSVAVGNVCEGSVFCPSPCVRLGGVCRNPTATARHSSEVHDTSSTEYGLYANPNTLALF